MPDERVIQQVSGILGMNNVKFQVDDSKQALMAGFGSSAILVSFVDYHESTLVSLRAIVLTQVDSGDEHREKILEALNERNKSAFFGTFYLVPEEGSIVVDHHLFGDELQEPELMHALMALANAADTGDDELRQAIGSGVRAIDGLQAASATEEAGPVVET